MSSCPADHAWRRRVGRRFAARFIVLRRNVSGGTAVVLVQMGGHVSF